jgi:hypothetical protein
VTTRVTDRRQPDRHRHRPQASVDTSVSFATPRNVPQIPPVTLTNTGNAELDVAHVTLTATQPSQAP